MIINPFNDHEDSDITFRDMITLALAGFICLLLLVIPHINPKGKEHAGIENPGSVVVEAIWDPKANVDIDLWVQAPGDIPVGYSNKGGVIFNLLRDDLGTMVDVTGLNYENSFSRGIPAGEYVVNLHLYNNKTANLPIDVNVVVSVTKINEAGYRLNTKQILQSTVKLSRVGEEITVFRFKLNENQDLIDSSVHSLYKGLRSYNKD